MVGATATLTPINLNVTPGYFQVGSIHFQQRMQQHIRAIGDILWS